MSFIEKVFSENAVPICFAANSEFVPYTAVMIQSVIDRADPEKNYDICVLYSDVREKMIKDTVSLADGKDNISIRFFDVSEFVSNLNFFTRSVYTKTRYSREAYYRLLIPTLMPDYDKVLYFDGDMVALTDVSELYEIDITGYMIASTRDYAGICHCYIDGDGRREYRERTLGLKNIDNYIISGMLVFNIPEFNKRYTAEELMDICSSRDWRQHDQDVLNVICEDKILILDGGWDFLEARAAITSLPDWLYDEYRKTYDTVKIVHFAGPRKPWVSGSSLYSDVFWKTCAKTPFFDSIFKSVYRNYGYKNFILKHVYGTEPVLSYSNGDACVTNSGYFVCRLSDIYTNIDYFTYEGGVLTVSGYVNFVGLTEDEEVEIYLSVDKEIYRCTVTKRDVSEHRFGTLLYRGVPFYIEHPIDPSVNHTVKIVSKIRGGNYIVSRNLRYGQFAALNDMREAYYFKDGVIFYTNLKNLYMMPAGLAERARHELRYLSSLGLKDKCKRVLYFLYRFFGGRGIWIFSDRYDVAGDNGEAMFRYVREIKPRGIKPYFVISRSSPDYKRLKKIGRVLPLESRKYRIYRLIADVILSSHCDTSVTLDYDKKVYSDLLMHQKTVFLQHGIIKDDLSAIYSKYRQNFDMFVTSAPAEYRSIVDNDNYGSSERIVRLTGLARYDLLSDKRERIVTVMPTWRHYCLINKRGRWLPGADYEKTEYFRFYNALINDERLLSSAKALGYKIEFVPHHLMSFASGAYSVPDGVELVMSPDYSEIFSKTSLLVTDFSSTAFDAAYLGKPILYLHFDKDKFFDTQYSAGYFDYERDGFGEVTYDLDSSVDKIIEYMESGCVMKPEYRERRDGFFAFSDKSCRERIFRTVLELLG